MVGIYARVVSPRLCDFVPGNPIVAEQRRNVLATAGGEVLEIGFGSGLNLAQYPKTVRKITTVDPSVGMSRRARARIEHAGIEVDQRLLSGEHLPFADGTRSTAWSAASRCAASTR